MQSTETEVANLMAHPWAYAGLPVRESSDMVLLLWSDFSLGVWSCWSIFQDGERFHVRRIEWARGLDRICVNGEAPTTFGTEASIPAHEVKRLTAEAATLVAANELVRSKEIRLDGTSRYLLLPRYHNLGQGLFWFTGSVNTMPLDAWLEEASVTLDNLLTQSTARRGTRAA